MNNFHIVIGRTPQEAEKLLKAVDRGVIDPFKTIQARSPLDLWGQILFWRKHGYVRATGVTPQDETIRQEWDRQMHALVGDVVMTTV